MREERDFGVMVDPPQGWRFGFPKVVGDPDVFLLDPSGWFVANGYPQEWIDLLHQRGELHYRLIAPFGDCDPEVERAAITHFQHDAKAYFFLARPHLTLDMRTPVEVARTPEGVAEVLGLLARGAAGV